MKFLPILALSVFNAAPIQASELFDLDAIRDAATLKTRVVHDWQPNAKDPEIHQKLIEVTICEWWPGQKVRLPVTFNIPAGASDIENLIVANSALALKTATPRGVELELLKERGVGVVLIGMGTIDAMEPKGTLHTGMKEHLLETRDVRYTPAWIWGMSQMRALTATAAESDIFQPKKVITTGGSKRGVAAAVAGIHDDRFTAILPVVAPILGNPGGSYVIGREDPDIVATNEAFFADLAAGKLPLDPAVKEALDGRSQRRADVRINLAQAQAADWSEAQITAITDRVWDACRITDFVPALKERGLDFFYIVGTNDSVSPALLELGKQLPDFPHYIVPGGQHGGPATAGFTRRVPILDETRENFHTFCLSHFFGARALPATPRITHHYDATNASLEVTAESSDLGDSTANTLWWSSKRHRPFTLPFEYYDWESAPMEKTAAGTWTARITVNDVTTPIDFVTTHRDVVNDLPFNCSSAYQRFAVPKR